VSGFTKINLKEIEAGGSSDVEARFARKHLESDRLGLSFFRYGPGYRSRTGHSHREQEELYVVVSGSGWVKLDDEIVELRPWDAVRVAPTTVRAFEGGPDGLELLAIGSDRPEAATASVSTIGGRTDQLDSRVGESAAVAV
jgi:mannose-6-phosphate isomerase-like protein (cupin superfamily)